MTEDDSELKARFDRLRADASPGIDVPDLAVVQDRVSSRARRSWLSLVVVVVVGAVVAAGTFATTRLRGSDPQVPAPPATHPPATHPSATHPRPTATFPVCLGSTIRATVVKYGSVMSQPFNAIAVRNTGHQSCRLRGYAQLTAFGHTDARTRTRALAITVSHAGLINRADPGPQTVTLAPHRAAYFWVGTATAYGPRPLVRITRLQLDLPGVRGPISVATDLYAGAPAHRLIPVNVTALGRLLGGPSSRPGE